MGNHEPLCVGPPPLSGCEACLSRMVHGLLIHGHEEFFICRSPASALGRDPSQETVLELLTSLDPEEWHHGFQVVVVRLQGSCRVLVLGQGPAAPGHAGFLVVG